MIRAEYLRFLQTLNSDTVPVDACKIANMVLQYLDTFIPLSTAQGQRVRKVVELAQATWETISADIQPIPEQVAEQTTPITQLKSLSVGPFRGFAKQEIFDLSSRLVLIYGPNGTGKSSFCEALEFGLLGNVAEAESKRFRNQHDYLKNAHTNTFDAPAIVGMDSQGQEVQVCDNEAIYRFCFVEKNRIDSFSRIAAQTPSKQTELISTLFGLDTFNEFVRNFTTEIDGRYIDLEGTNTKQLNEKRQALAGFQQLLDSSPKDLKKLDDEEQVLAQQYRNDATFAQMVTELNEDGEKNPGSIQQLETELQQPIATKSNVTVSALQALKQSIRTNLTDLTAKQQKLTAASQQVSFKQLYEAVTQLQSSSPEQCPACKTPLTQSAINPYNHADEELIKLQHLAELQQAEKEVGEKIGQSMFELSQIINTCCTHIPKENQLSTCQVSSSAKANIEWWNSLYQKLEDGFTPWQHLEVHVGQLEKADVEIEQASQQRSIKQEELKRLRDFALKITVLTTRREIANDTITKAQQAINNFDIENAQLIANAEAEKEIVARNQNIANAYTTFVNSLNAYKNALPAQLVSDLGETVVTLYNAFNRYDAKGEQLASVRLPLAQNQTLEISFQKNPDVYFDALHVLSEGHIRCIGLAILAAKNIRENCQLLIFDDPVNAIDDDHREAIRRTLFEDLFFTEKQIILTCHGEEFFKDIQNLLSAERVSQSKTMAFLPRLNEQHIIVDFRCAPRNYIIAARTHHQKNEIRDALGKSRQALESLAKGKVWRYVNRYGDGNLSIKLRSATAPIELRNLTEQLKTKIAKADFSDPNKGAVLTPVETLLGINGDSREWRYLNKGIHEEADREEFDRQTVNEILIALEQLDVAFGENEFGKTG